MARKQITAEKFNFESLVPSRARVWEEWEAKGPRSLSGFPLGGGISLPPGVALDALPALC
jgi:hypothetical protein